VRKNKLNKKVQGAAQELLESLDPQGRKLAFVMLTVFTDATQAKAIELGIDRADHTPTIADMMTLFKEFTHDESVRFAKLFAVSLGELFNDIIRACKARPAFLASLTTRDLRDIADLEYTKAILGLKRGAKLTADMFDAMGKLEKFRSLTDAEIEGVGADAIKAVIDGLAAFWKGQETSRQPLRA
jgi:hypothetical protein